MDLILDIREFYSGTHDVHVETGAYLRFGRVITSLLLLSAQLGGMVLILFVAQALAPDTATTNAIAVATIQRAVVAREADWNEAPAPIRRETIEKLPSGESYLLRVIDFE